MPAIFHGGLNYSGGGGSASDVSYDNTTSALSATNVQNAIDEVNAKSGVTGVKGDSESTYHTGNINITKANIGLENVPNVTTNNQTPTFTQASSRANIASNETLTTIFGKIMKWFADLKNGAFINTIWSGSVSCIVGDTTCTINNSNIATSSVIEPHASIYGINITSITVSAGKVVLTFDSLAQATTFRVRITNL